MSSYPDSTFTPPAGASLATPAPSAPQTPPAMEGNPSASISPHRASALVIPEYDGEAPFFPDIPGFSCAECGSARPGAGANRKSFIETASGFRRGGRCQTCGRVAKKAQKAFRTTTDAYMAQHAGPDIYSRREALKAALVQARLAMWALYTGEAMRQTRRQQAAGVIR